MRLLSPLHPMLVGRHVPPPLAALALICTVASHHAARIAREASHAARETFSAPRAPAAP